MYTFLINEDNSMVFLVSIVYFRRRLAATHSV